MEELGNMSEATIETNFFRDEEQIAPPRRRGSSYRGPSLSLSLRFKLSGLLNLPQNISLIV